MQLFSADSTKFKKKIFAPTAIPYRASTGPEQDFPCVVFPCEKNYTGKTLFSLQGWVCSVDSLNFRTNGTLIPLKNVKSRF